MGSAEPSGQVFLSLSTALDRGVDLPNTPVTPRLFVDARMAFHSGIGRYIRNHLALLREYDYTVLVAVQKRQHEQWLRRYIDGRTDHLHFAVHRYSTRGFWQLLRLPQFSAKWKADIFWFPHLLAAPYMCPPNSVVTVHDVIPLHNGRTVRDKAKRIVTRLTLRAVADRASRIVCGSPSVAEELLKVHPEVQSKLSVTGNGVLLESWVSLSDEQRRGLRSTLGLGRYLLAVGIEEERKNHALLLGLLERLPASLSEVSIVLAGERAKRRGKHSETNWQERVRNWMVSNPELAGRFLQLGEVNELQLWKLYAAADALLFPSLDEGFGLPVLEAMACGTCVIASNRPPISVVAGQHSLLADPEDVESWVDKVVWLLERPEEMRKRRAEGLRYVRERWAWQTSTRRLVEVFDSMLGRPSRLRSPVDLHEVAARR